MTTLYKVVMGFHNLVQGCQGLLQPCTRLSGAFTTLYKVVMGLTTLCKVVTRYLQLHTTYYNLEQACDKMVTC